MKILIYKKIIHKISRKDDRQRINLKIRPYNFINILHFYYTH